jgi:catechol 2,3-dioxygenase-like lactoylglutathione lyase family enzyme
MAAQERQPSIAVRTVCIDCADAHETAAFYSRLLGWAITDEQPDWALVRDPNGGTGLSFQAEKWYEPPAWPEEKGRQSKMLHLDLQVDDLDAAVAHAIASGARLADEQPGDRFRVFLDPAGHPFCLFLD